MFAFKKIRTRLIITISLLLLIVIGILSGVTSYLGGKSIRDEKEIKLQTLQDNLSFYIQKFAEQNAVSLLGIAEQNTTLNLVQELSNARAALLFESQSWLTPEILKLIEQENLEWNKSFLIPILKQIRTTPLSPPNFLPIDQEAQVLRYIYTIKNPNPAGKRFLGTYSSDIEKNPQIPENIRVYFGGTTYSTRHDLVHKGMIKNLERLDLYDILILDPTGNIVYSVQKEIDFATNVYRDRNLIISDLHERCMKMEGEKGSVITSDFKIYEPSYDAPSLFIATAIKSESGTASGVIVFQINPKSINQALSFDGNYEKVGFGKSGDAYLYGNDGTIRSESRFLAQLAPSAKRLFFDASATPTGNTGVLQSKVGEKILAQTTDKLQIAVFDNLLGEECISAFGYLPLWDIKVGLIVQQGLSESLAPTRRLISTILAIGFVILVVGYGVAYYLSGKISNPISSLREIALKAGAGDLTVKASTESKDEVGDLASQFNQMLGEIRQRTAQNERIMETVGQGLFLVDGKGIVSPEHSKETERIFGQPLGNKSLLTVLRPLLNDKAYLNLKDYLDILFDPKKREKLIVKANPLQEIEISRSDERGNVKSHILEFKFNRVIENNQILQILVTVSDITRRIMLEREFKEIEKRSDSQLQMLLSVAHLDPQNLNQFLSSSLTLLQSVQTLLKNEDPVATQSSEDRSDRYRQLLREIYRPIHFLKGNASVLRLKFFTEESSQLEEKIEKMGALSKIHGEDFLPITMSTGRLLDQVTTTQDLIRRFGELKSEKGVDLKSANKDLTAYLHSNLFKFVKETAMSLGKEAILNTDQFSYDPFTEKEAEEVSTMLNQLIKNALVHGIEKTADRQLAQKPIEGKIMVSSQAGIQGQALIRVADDGGGIDPALILRKAIEKGLVKESESQTLTENEIFQLLFRSGFSTVEIADEHAGRGVGLEAVKEWVEGKKGKISIQSTIGKGSEISLEFFI